MGESYVQQCTGSPRQSRKTTPCLNSYSLWIYEQRLAYEQLGALGHPSEQVLREGELALRYIQVSLLLGVASEGRVAAEEDVG